MKKFIIIYLLIATCFAVSAQDKKLSKVETVAFMNSTLQSLVGLQTSMGMGIIKEISFTEDSYSIAEEIENEEIRYINISSIKWESLITDSISTRKYLLCSGIKVKFNKTANYELGSSKLPFFFPIESGTSEIEFYIPIDKAESFKKACLRLHDFALSKLEDDKNITMFEDKGKIGYKDASGKIVIAAKYDSTSEFFENIAVVELNKKMGIIDSNGNELTKIIYDIVVPESDQKIIWVGIDFKYGLINFQGKNLTPIHFVSLDYFYSHKLAPVTIGNLWGYIDINGKEIIPFKYDAAYRFSNERALVNGAGDLGLGFIDENGNEVIPLIYQSADHFDENGIATVKYPNKDTYTMIDKNGTQVFPECYRLLKLKSNYAVKEYKSSSFKLVDKNYKILKTSKFKTISYSLEGEIKLFRFTDEKGKYGFINADFEIVINSIYDDCDSWYVNGLCPVKLNENWGIIDTSGKTIVPFEYSSIKRENSQSKNFKVMKDNKEYVIDSKGIKISK